MCGIAGCFGIADRVALPRMLARLVHRGPDDAGEVYGANFALGARRLSIMDPERGRQPCGNETQTIWAVQNGEIYNFPELQQQLSACGHHLRTGCDTELLPHLYEEHGTELPRVLDGMFAIALWDDVRQQGLLCRDRLGKKPLYYCQLGQALYFASEIKALLKIPGFQPALNLNAVSHYLSFKHVPQPGTSFAGIQVLPPAHLLVFRPGQSTMLQRYWDVPNKDEPALAARSEEALVDELLALLRRAVTRRLRADVPVGFFLSGGLDSSLVLALADGQSSRCKTFTLGYRDEGKHAGKQQDRHWASWAADTYGTEHHEEEIGPADFLVQFRAVLRAFDEPFAGVTSTYFLARRIGQHVKVALSGDGADELFGSYLSHRLALPLAHFEQFQATGDLELIRPFQQEPDYLKSLATRDDWRWRSKLVVFNRAEKRRLFSPELLEGDSSERLWRRAFRGLHANDPLNRVLKAELGSIFPDQVLTFVDRLAMAHGLEVRCPFLDTALVEFAARLPACWKIRQGETKYLLKRAAQRFFPADMVARPKEGFVMPLYTWLRDHWEDYVRAQLSPAALAAHGLFRAAEVQRLVDDFYAGDHSLASKILTLLTFQEWFEEYRPALQDGLLAQSA